MTQRDITDHANAAGRQSSVAVSVIMLAYNHEPFVEQAIESVAAQRFDRCFELLIGEDCSTDGTRELCRKAAERFPDIVRLFEYRNNIGMHASFARLWEAAEGEYIAFCEGDDYWCDDGKLQKQFDFLSSRPGFVMCGAYTTKIVQNPAGEWRPGGRVAPTEVKDTYTLDDLIPGYCFHFSSVMLRKRAVSFPEWFTGVYCVDRPLYLLAAENGDAGLIPEVLSVYRQHGGGAWSSISGRRKAQGSVHLFSQLKQHFGAEYSDRLDRALGEILWAYMSESLAGGEIDMARELYWKACKYLPAGRIVHRLKDHLVVLVRLYLPGAYRRLSVGHER